MVCLSVSVKLVLASACSTFIMGLPKGKRLPADRKMWYWSLCHEWEVGDLFIACKDCFKDGKPADINSHQSEKRICSYNPSSNSAYVMQRHIEKKHPELVPQEHQKKTAVAADAVTSPKATESAAKWLVAYDLQPFSCTSKTGFRQYLAEQKHERMPGQRKAVTKAFDKQAVNTKQDLKDRIAKLKSRRTRFSLSADAWKTKGRRRRNYHAIFAHWVSPGWQHETACIGVQELPKVKDHRAYVKSTEDIMASVGLERSDIVFVNTDHDGTIRKCMGKLGFPKAGCGCHLVQLPFLHVRPPLRHPRKKENHLPVHHHRLLQLRLLRLLQSSLRQIPLAVVPAVAVRVTAAVRRRSCRSRQHRRSQCRSHRTKKDEWILSGSWCRLSENSCGRT